MVCVSAALFVFAPALVDCHCFLHWFNFCWFLRSAARCCSALLSGLVEYPGLNWPRRLPPRPCCCYNSIRFCFRLQIQFKFQSWIVAFCDAMTRGDSAGPRTEDPRRRTQQHEARSWEGTWAACLRFDLDFMLVNTSFAGPGIVPLDSRPFFRRSLSEFISQMKSERNRNRQWERVSAGREGPVWLLAKSNQPAIAI